MPHPSKATTVLVLGLEKMTMVQRLRVIRAGESREKNKLEERRKVRGKETLGQKSCRIERETKLRCRRKVLSARVAPSETNGHRNSFAKAKQNKTKKTETKKPRQFRSGSLPEDPLCPLSMSCSFCTPASRAIALTG